jgi:hypothetical protein
MIGPGRARACCCPRVERTSCSLCRPPCPQSHNYLTSAPRPQHIPYRGTLSFGKAWDVADISRPVTCHNGINMLAAGINCTQRSMTWGGGALSPKRGSSNALGPLGQARALDVPRRCCCSRCDLSFEAKQIATKKGATASGDPETMPCVASWVEARLRHSPLALWTLDTGR